MSFIRFYLKVFLIKFSLIFTERKQIPLDGMRKISSTRVCKQYLGLAPPVITQTGPASPQSDQIIHVQFVNFMDPITEVEEQFKFAAKNIVYYKLLR